MHVTGVQVDDSQDDTNREAAHCHHAQGQHEKQPMKDAEEGVGQRASNSERALSSKSREAKLLPVPMSRSSDLRALSNSPSQF